MCISLLVRLPAAVDAEREMSVAQAALRAAEDEVSKGTQAQASLEQVCVCVHGWVSA
jgi:Tfp pilus assembly protein PilX